MIYGAKIKNFDPIGGILITLAGLESFIFLFFTGDFLFEQLESVKDNQTCIESYQYKRGVSVSTDQNFINVFGKNSWFWLIPVSPDLDIDYEERIINERLEHLIKHKQT
jgi:hypothetical protein